MIRYVRGAVFLAALALPGVAMATPQGTNLMNVWKATDHCAERAQKAYPDFTAESNAKRDAEMKKCLAAGNLPPRGSLDLPAKP
jgi:hypothetical protein